MNVKANNKNIDDAVSLISKGNIIVYPTDTLYGFGVDATNNIAITKLNKLKKRTQPLSIIIDEIISIKDYAIINTKKINYLKNILPGPFTILLKKKKSIISNLVTLNSPNIGIRIPKHSFAINLVKKLKRPIITTSINMHGKEPINEVKKINSTFPKITIFSDENNKRSLGSTIIDFSKKNPEIIRQGDGTITK